ncbi:MAG: DNA polymerase/3'-5' exonuclease PolX, partial [Methylocystaceae bacterium]
MSGIDAAILLEEIADRLELLGDNPHKVRAYRNAALSLGHLDQNLEAIWLSGKLKSIPGVGEAIAAKIDELMTTGSIELHRELSDRLPPGVLEMLSIPGLGPRTVSII